MFAVFYKGSKYLHFQQIDWWFAGLLSLGIGGLVAGFLWVYGIKIIRARAIRMHERELAENESENRKVPKDAVSVQKGVLHHRMKIILDHSTEPNTPNDTSANSPAVHTPDNGLYLTPKYINRSGLDLKSTAESPSNYSPGVWTLNTAGSTAQLIRTPISGLEPTKLPQLAVDPKSLKARLKDLVIPAEEDPKTIKVFHFLQIMSACFLSFSHGSNDTANSVGPLIGLWLNYKYGLASVDASHDISLEIIIIFGAVSMIIGLWVMGHKVIRTIGSEITKVTAPSGFCMELATAFTVIMGTRLGIPLSTTHCMVGAVVIVGFVKAPKNGVKWRVFGSICLAWITTLPVTMAVSALITYLLGHFYYGSM